MDGQSSGFMQMGRMWYFEAWCCTSKFCSCCTDLNQLVWGNPVAKHRGASLDGIRISRFYFVAHACLPLYFVILLRQSILILEFFCVPSVSQGQSSRIRIRCYKLFQQQTDLTKHAGTFAHSFLPFFGPSFLFFAFPAAMPCKSAKPDGLEQRIIVSGVNERSW